MEPRSQLLGHVCRNLNVLNECQCLWAEKEFYLSGNYNPRVLDNWLTNFLIKEVMNDKDFNLSKKQKNELLEEITKTTFDYWPADYEKIK